LNESKLARAVDRHEQMELALFRADLRDVDVKVADRIGLELSLHRRQTVPRPLPKPQLYGS